MKYAVRFLSVSEEDLGSVLDHISLNNPPAARKLLASFENKFELLRDNPLLGKLPLDETLREFGYRYLVVSNYLVFYVVRQNEVVIHRVLHGARNYLDLL